MAKQVLGIEIGGTKLQLAVGDASGERQRIIRLPADAAAGAAGIQRQIEDSLSVLMNEYDIAAIGVGFGGPVDPKSGHIRVSHQVSGWAGFNLAQWLQQKTGKPVAVDNDANTAALAEALHGSGKGQNVVFYMTIGSGIGGGLVINNQIYHGRSPGEAEVGHLRLNKEGETVEDKCSGWAVDKKVKLAIAKEPNGLLAALAREQQEAPGAKLLHQALKKTDANAQKIIAETADDLAFGLSHVVHLFHPDVLVIGGGLSLLNEQLLGRIAERLPAYVMKAFLPAPPIKIASLGENVVPVGAMELAKGLVAMPKQEKQTGHEKVD
jgi:glucokinase